MNYHQALKETKMQALISGGVTQVNGKQLTGQNGYYYLDGEKADPVLDIYPHIEVDEDTVKSMVTERTICPLCGGEF